MVTGLVIVMMTTDTKVVMTDTGLPLSMGHVAIMSSSIRTLGFHV